MQVSPGLTWDGAFRQLSETLILAPYAGYASDLRMNGYQVVVNA